AAILLNAGNGTYTRKNIPLPLFFENDPGYNASGIPDRATDLIAGDFNADGKMDLAYVDRCGGCDVRQEAIFVLWNDGTANFTAQWAQSTQDGTMITTSGVDRLKTLDADMDGRSDLYFDYNGCHTPCQGSAVLYSDSAGKFTVV